MYRDNNIYSATNGGMVAFDLFNASYRVLTNTDGLPVNRQVCCAFDSTGYIWSGNEMGLVFIDSSFNTVYQYPITIISSYVQDIVTLRDSVYVGSPAGLLFIQTQSTPETFDDDLYTRLYVQNGLLSNNVKTIAVQEQYVWAGTDQGITRFVKSFHPDSLEQYTDMHGLLSNNIEQIEAIGDSIYVATDQGLNVFNGVSFDTVINNTSVFDVSYLGDTIVVALDTLHQVGLYYQGTLTFIQDGLPYKCRVLDVENFNGELYCGLGNQWSEDRVGMGIGHYDIVSGQWSIRARKCLPSNHISEISANEYGVFCALGARKRYSRGIGWLHEDDTWSSFTRDSILPSNNIHRCVMAPDGRMWFGINAFSSSGGDTIMLISYDVDHDNWLFIPRGYLNIDTTVAVWDIEFDHRNNLFMALAGPSDKLWVIDSALQTATYLGLKREGFNVEIAIDPSDVVWRTVSGSDGGLIMVDTRQTIFERNDDVIREFNTSDGLISKYAFGCVVASDSTLYVANDTGLLAYDNNSFRSYTDIADEEHFDVVTDSEDRIWIMTRTGIYYYDPVYDLVHGWKYYELGVHIQFLEFSNEVIQIQGFAFDSLRSCFWLGGETGLLQLSIVEDTEPDFDSILVYPNPAVAVPVVRIKNLPVDSRVSIFSITGRLLAGDLVPDRVFNEVVWHIPDDAASGLYFALIQNASGSKVCKFAIIK